MDKYRLTLLLKNILFLDLPEPIGWKNLVNQNNNISEDKEIKKLKERIKEFQVVKNFQQDMIPGLKIITRFQVQENQAKQIEIGI